MAAKVLYLSPDGMRGFPAGNAMAVEMTRSMQDKIFALEPGESLVVHRYAGKQVRVSRRGDGVAGLWMEVEDAKAD